MSRLSRFIKPSERETHLAVRPYCDACRFRFEVGEQFIHRTPPVTHLTTAAALLHHFTYNRIAPRS
jgi:hypothetical protein